METINIESVIRVSIKSKLIVPRIIQVFAFQNTIIQIKGVIMISGWVADGAGVFRKSGVSIIVVRNVGLYLV